MNASGSGQTPGHADLPARLSPFTESMDIAGKTEGYGEAAEFNRHPLFLEFP
jgi:hypothetical protein